MAFALGAGMLMLAGAAPAQATLRNGLIAYSQRINCNFENSVCSYRTFTVRPDGRGRRRLSCSLVFRRRCSDAIPRFSPKGRVLAISADPVQSLGSYLAFRRPGGRMLRPIQITGGYRDFAWGPSGRRFAVNEGGKIGLRSLRSKKTRRFRYTQEGLDVAWSRQGRLAWGDDITGDLFVTDKRLKRVRRLRLGHRAADWPRWSPDGQRLAFLDQRGGAYSVKADGTRLKLVARGCDYFQSDVTSALAWSPDGRQIACNSSGDLSIYDVETGRERVHMRGINPYSIDWQPLQR